MKRLALCAVALSLSGNPVHLSIEHTRNIVPVSRVSPTPRFDPAYRWIPAFHLAISSGQYRYEQTEFGFNPAFYAAANSSSPNFDSPSAIPPSERLRLRVYFDRFIAPTLSELNLQTLAPAFTDNYFLVYHSSNPDQSLRSSGVIGCFLRSLDPGAGVGEVCNSDGPNFFFFNSRVSDPDIVRRNVIHETLHDWRIQGLSPTQAVSFLTDLNELLTNGKYPISAQFLAFYHRGYEGCYDSTDPQRNWKLFLENEGYPVLWETGGWTHLPSYYAGVFVQTPLR
ncbi:hypothetical protein HY990_07125 [Candidatus Micrarchaeota archaeon]|nr:hypothetical protein [Candidatus Micrarchaeota archaeon]